jgi:hypothetical protein
MRLPPRPISSVSPVSRFVPDTRWRGVGLYLGMDRDAQAVQPHWEAPNRFHRGDSVPGHERWSGFVSNWLVVGV